MNTYKLNRLKEELFKCESRIELLRSCIDRQTELIEQQRAVITRCIRVLELYGLEHHLSDPPEPNSIVT